jgi:hypothetical protein
VVVNETETELLVLLLLYSIRCCIVVKVLMGGKLLGVIVARLEIQVTLFAPSEGRLTLFIVLDVDIV